MARRVPFSIAQPITIAGFWVASILLIALVAVADNDFDKAGVRDQALTQAYYYGIFAACLYQIISYLMCVTVWGAYRGHYSKEFKLTAAQRTLMLQTISFLVYQHVWALAYSHIEGWNFLDAVYWADFTSLTIGIGADYVPRSHLGRSLLFPFALGGIVILGLVIGSIRSLVLDRGKKKMAARMTEKTRRRLVAQIEKSIKSDRVRRRHNTGMRLGKDMCEALTIQPGDDNMKEKDRRQYEFEAMRKVQKVAASRRQYISLAISTFAFAFLWIMGAYVFYKSEKNQGWSYFGCLYFAYTSLLTIGYGDLQPISNSGKPFFVFWSLLAIPTLTILISNMGDTVVKGVKDATIWLGEVTVLPSDNASVTSRLKYGLERLTLGLIDPEKNPKLMGKKSTDSDDYDFQELHPGLAKVLGGRGRRKVKQKQQDANERLASNFEAEEKIAEEEAKDRGDKISEDEHAYRREVLAQIRQCYADATAAQPKQYSYQEWAYFLKLLGEDEADEKYHLRASPSRKQPRKKHGRALPGMLEDGRGGQSSIVNPHRSGDVDDDDEPVKWSWIGSKSPLMGDKDEAEWLLSKLFQRLEESMQESQQKMDEAAQQWRQSSVQKDEPSDQETIQEETDENVEQDPRSHSSGRT
jgi:potassium channel subfamily K, other eukaryote